MKVVSESNAEHYLWGDQCDGWHLAKSATMSVIRERVPAGCSEVRHYHTRAEQFFYVLGGVATIEVSGETGHISSGHGVFVGAGEIHKLSNASTDDLVFLVISSPPSHGDKVVVE